MTIEDKITITEKMKALVDSVMGVEREVQTRVKGENMEELQIMLPILLETSCYVSLLSTAWMELIRGAEHV